MSEPVNMKPKASVALHNKIDEDEQPVVIKLQTGTTCRVNWNNESSYCVKACLSLYCKKIR